MSSHRVGYTINPETGKQIKIGGPTWKRLAATYYMDGNTFTDQTMPDIYASDVKQRSPLIRSNRTPDPKGEKHFIIMGRSTWNKRYLEYEWNGHEFGEKRQRHLPAYLNTVEKRREMRRNKAFERFDRKVSQERLSDVIDSSLGYALTHVLSHRGRRHVQGMDERETNQEGLSSQE